MTEVLWVVVGIIIGTTTGILGISLVSSGKFEDQQNEIYDLRVQRELLKGEIERLNKPRRKPTPRKKRHYRPRNKGKKI